MKDYLIRLIFGLLTIGIFLGIATIFNVDWLQEENHQRNIFILPVGLVGGWGGWYLYNGYKNKKDKLK